MFKRFKEIWYGIFFGAGAVVIDTIMHARMLNQSFVDVLLKIEGEMVFYRLLFLGFGLASGWLLWRNNRREREFRNLQERFLRFQKQLAPLLTVSYSRLQLLLTRPETKSLSPELVQDLHTVHGDLRRSKSILESWENEGAETGSEV